MTEEELHNIYDRLCRNYAKMVKRVKDQGVKDPELMCDSNGQPIFLNSLAAIANLGAALHRIERDELTATCLIECTCGEEFNDGCLQHGD